MSTNCAQLLVFSNSDDAENVPPRPFLKTKTVTTFLDSTCRYVYDALSSNYLHFNQCFNFIDPSEI